MHGTDQSGSPGYVELAQLGVESLLLGSPGVAELQKQNSPVSYKHQQTRQIDREKR